MWKNRRAIFPIRIRIYLAILLICALLNWASWMSTAFSDFYTNHIFVLWTNLLGRISGLFSFSLGERMIIAGLLWLAAGVLLLLIWAFRTISARRNGAGSVSFKVPGIWLRITAWLLAVIFLIMTLNCFILYHCTPLEKTLPGYGKEYTLSDLEELRDMVVTRCNELSGAVPRDENGDVLYERGIDAMRKEAIESIRSLDYPRLSGYTVTPKALTFSGFISQQHMQGYYFPFSMEANYNDVMKIMHFPSTMCHELSHTHGYIFEDDANFLGFLACISSDDPVFQYSGWLSVLNYVDNDFWYAVDRDTYYSHVKIDSAVRKDNEFLSDEAWKKVEDNAVLDTETVKKAADTFVDTTLKVNGVADGKVSYSHVVALLLSYFDGEWK